MNNQRIKTFDLVRGMALILMVCVHVIDTFGNSELQNSFSSLLVYLLTSPFGAPAFIIIMGIFFQISDKPSIKTSIIRGIKLIILGYVLNIIRFTIPVLLATHFKIVTLDVFAPSTPTLFTLELDILHFAGLALIFMAIIKKYLKHPLFYLILAIIIVGCSPLLWNISSRYFIINFFLDYLWGKDIHISFPIFPWFAYTLIGMSYGHYLKSHQFSSIFFRKSTILGLLLFALGAYWIWLAPPFSKLQDIHKFAIGCVLPNIVLATTGALLLWISLCHVLTSIIKPNFVFDRLYFWSKHVTSFYFIQWVLIGWLSMEIGEIEWAITGLLIIIVILTVTDRFLLIRKRIS